MDETGCSPKAFKVKYVFWEVAIRLLLLLLLIIFHQFLPTYARPWPSSRIPEITYLHETQTVSEVVAGAIYLAECLAIFVFANLADYLPRVFSNKRPHVADNLTSVVPSEQGAAVITPAQLVPRSPPGEEPPSSVVPSQLLVKTTAEPPMPPSVRANLRKPPTYPRLSVWQAFRRVGVDFILVVCLGLTASVLITLIITEFLKHTVGSYRPDYLSRCYALPSVEAVSEKAQQLMMLYETSVIPCPDPALKTTVPEKVVRDARLSFPSGHTSAGFASVGYIALYAFRKFEVWRSPFSAIGLARIAIPFSTLLVPLWITITRLHNNAHRSTDLLGGGIIGAATAIACFYFHYRKGSFYRRIYS